MAKKKKDEEIKILLEAISFMKSTKEEAPSNPKILEGLDLLEKGFQDELFKVMSEKLTIGI